MGWASSIGDRVARDFRPLSFAIPLLAAAVLLAEGRSPICPCGTVKLWHGSVQSAENSQQLLDWYSLSHLVHGLLFYLAGWAALRSWPPKARLVVALAIEAGWEVLENSPLIIDRYRAVTVTWGYAGDSILNSLADMGCMAVGFTLARRLPPWGAVLLGVTFELVALAAIRDNLTLNILMLIHPVEAVRVWQAG